MIRLFLDANVFVAASASTQGGSALLLEISRKGLFEIVTSHLALLEAERNVRKKLPSSALKRYHHLLETTPLRMTPSPTAEEFRRYQNLIHEKDAPILAAAVAGKADFLITLDQRHFMTEPLRRAHLPLKIVTPGQFLQGGYVLM